MRLLPKVIGHERSVKKKFRCLVTPLLVRRASDQVVWFHRYQNPCLVLKNNPHETIDLVRIIRVVLCYQVTRDVPHILTLQFGVPVGDHHLSGRLIVDTHRGTGGTFEVPPLCRCGVSGYHEGIAGPEVPYRGCLGRAVPSKGAKDLVALRLQEGRGVWPDVGQFHRSGTSSLLVFKFDPTLRISLENRWTQDG